MITLSGSDGFRMKEGHFYVKVMPIATLPLRLTYTPGEHSLALSVEKSERETTIFDHIGITAVKDPYQNVSKYFCARSHGPGCFYREQIAGALDNLSFDPNFIDILQPGYEKRIRKRPNARTDRLSRSAHLRWGYELTRTELKTSSCSYPHTRGPKSLTR
jgi:hypothetical protein